MYIQNLRLCPPPHISVTCRDGDLRLVGGDAEINGILQMCDSSRWTAVGGERWGRRDTRVACQQLNFSLSGLWHHNLCCLELIFKTHLFT